MSLMTVAPFSATRRSSVLAPTMRRITMSARLSPLTSLKPTTDQPPVVVRSMSCWVVPRAVMRHTQRAPLRVSFQSRSARLSPSKSPIPTMRARFAGATSEGLRFVYEVLPHSQTDEIVESSAKRRVRNHAESDLPSPFTSSWT